jgi:hypothetical protein
MGNIFSDEADEGQDYHHDEKKQTENIQSIEKEKEAPKKHGKQNTKQTNATNNTNNNTNNNTTTKRRRQPTKSLLRNKSKSSNRRFL